MIKRDAHDTAVVEMFNSFAIRARLPGLVRCRPPRPAVAWPSDRVRARHIWRLTRLVSVLIQARIHARMASALCVRRPLGGDGHCCARAGIARRRDRRGPSRQGRQTASVRAHTPRENPVEDRAQPGGSAAVRRLTGFCLFGWRVHARRPLPSPLWRSSSFAHDRPLSPSRTTSSSSSTRSRPVTCPAGSIWPRAAGWRDATQVGFYGLGPAPRAEESSRTIG